HWNYDRNGLLKPENFAPKSRISVWWICKNGHEWKRKISKVVNHRAVCKVCKSLGFKQSPLLNEWNNTKNHPLTSFDIAFSSNKKVWWKCIRGHEWQASPNSRHRSNGKIYSCPFCKKQ
ncbi:zinc-ribbon domain-containing protein, partial [Brevibacillus brevis]|uniref:zinc-ribbon domain-containing protein n=1 Tax=Brevibacillus brevis TaxID=1393 RepID=UPI001C129A55